MSYSKDMVEGLLECMKVVAPGGKIEIDSRGAKILDSRGMVVVSDGGIEGVC